MDGIDEILVSEGSHRTFIRVRGTLLAVFVLALWAGSWCGRVDPGGPARPAASVR